MYAYIYVCMYAYIYIYIYIYKQFICFMFCVKINGEVDILYDAGWYTLTYVGRSFITCTLFVCLFINRLTELSLVLLIC